MSLRRLRITGTRLTALSALALTAWAAGLGMFTPATASATFPGSPGLIAVGRSADPNSSNIWTLDWRTGAARQLTYDDYAAEPAFSPDGQWIAYRSDASRYGRINIWAIRANGKGRHRLTLGHGELEPSSPTFSANGRWVAFTTNPPGTVEAEIDKVALAGGHRQVLVKGTPKRWAIDPAYSPDGRSFAWVQPDILFGKPTGPFIFIGDTQARGGRRLTVGREPQFSPDGRSIVFVREGRCANGALGTQIVTLSLDTGVQWPIRESCEAQLAVPTYSPDGSWIVYNSFSSPAEKWELEFAPVHGVTPPYAPFPGLGTDLPVDEVPSWQPIR